MSRRKKDEGVTKLPCGCKHNDTHWLFVCEMCRVPWAELHQIAKEYHDAKLHTMAEQTAQERVAPGQRAGSVS